MNAVLSQAQQSVQRELERMQSWLSGISANISAIGLNGSAVRAQLNQARGGRPLPAGHHHLQLHPGSS